MKTIANFERGVGYLYVHKSTLACHFIAGAKLVGPVVPFHTKCPEPKDAFHRVSVQVIRTKKEAAAVDRKFAKLRKDRALCPPRSSSISALKSES